MFRLRAKRTIGSSPPAEMLFGEIAFSDANQRLYVGRSAEDPPATFLSDLSPITDEIAALTTATGEQADAIAALQAQAAALPVVGSILQLPYPVTLSAGLWSSPTGLIYYAPHGGTIGAPDSGATVANAIMESLYLALWAHLGAATPGWSIQTAAGGASTAGASAAADWAANKRLAVPDCRGRVVVAAGQGSGLTNRPVGSSWGAETHALSAAENGPHSHVVPIIRTPSGPGYDMPAVPGNGSSIGPQDYPTTASGSGAPHNNMQPSFAAIVLWFVGVAP